MILHSQITPESPQIAQDLPKIMHFGRIFLSGPCQKKILQYALPKMWVKFSTIQIRIEVLGLEL